MEWPRKQIGVIKDRGGESGLRIELAVVPGPSTDRLVCLHDEDNVGTVARVFAGQLRQGGFTLPLAVKIQRDNALTDEDAKSVAAKFDCERAAYRKLQAMPSGQKVTARLHDFTDESDPHAARLRPSIICRHALHALEPLCPKCGRPLSEPGLVSHEERRLVCDHCDARYVNRDEIKHAIVRRSVRQVGLVTGAHKMNPPVHGRLIS